MTESVLIAIIGGAAGIIGALTVLIGKVYEIYKDHKGDTVEKRIGQVVQKIVDDKVDPIIARQKDVQCDVARMRLLDLIRYEPEDAENIIKVGERYFCEFHGNSEASKQFSRWYKAQYIKKPDWFHLEEQDGKE